MLSSKNKEASVLHANLIANLKNELAGFENEKQKQLLAAETEINARREARREYYRRLREESRHAASEEKERLLVDREKRTTEVAALKMRIKTAREPRRNWRRSRGVSAITMRTGRTWS